MWYILFKFRKYLKYYRKYLNLRNMWYIIFNAIGNIWIWEIFSLTIFICKWSIIELINLFFSYLYKDGRPIMDVPVGWCAFSPQRSMCIFGNSCTTCFTSSAVSTTWKMETQYVSQFHDTMVESLGKEPNDINHSLMLLSK
jgi:hypothetical protein